MLKSSHSGLFNYLEVSEFIRFLLISNNAEPVTEVVLLEVLLGKVLQVSEEK